MSIYTQKVSDDSPRLQAGGFWIDTGVSSHTDSSLHAHKRDLAQATCVSHGTSNVGDVTAFTHGNDLPWNAQTVFNCSCTKELFRASFSA